MAVSTRGVVASLGPAAETKLLDVDPGRFRYTAWKNLTISVWADQATVEAARRVTEVSKRVIAEHPEGHSTVVFILNGAPAPTPEAQAIFGELYNPTQSDLVCMGVVLEGEGFWASAMRSMILKLRMASPGRLTIRVQDTVDALLDWLPELHLERTQIALDRAELKSVLLATRAAGVEPR